MSNTTTATNTNNNNTDPHLSCHCFSNRPYSDCCEPVVTAVRPAATAEELMRARYSAYATGAIEFIISSTHPARRPECDEKAIRLWSANSEWTGFEIVSVDSGGAGDSEGKVEFIARYTEDRMKKTLHETGTFKRGDDNLWHYVDGTIHPPQPFIRPQEDRINRNDPCPCGSGKKHKKCCINKES